MGRLTAADLVKAVDDLDSIATEINYIEITAPVAQSAGVLAQTHGLRGYDAVHLASAALANDDQLVMVTGDSKLRFAAQSIGISGLHRHLIEPLRFEFRHAQASVFADRLTLRVSCLGKRRVRRVRCRSRFSCRSLIAS